MSAYTPGPWESHGKYVFAGSDCIGICDTDNATDGRMKANARLMAAAPKLLVVAKAAMAFIDSHAADPDITEEMVSAYNALKLLEPHDVIAKAEGREP